MDLNTLNFYLHGFDVIESVERRSSLSFIRVPKAQLFSVLSRLEREAGFSTLTTITCTDWIEDDVFCLTYLLETATRDAACGVQVHIARSGEAMDSAIGLWPQAEIFERELHEMYGIDFVGHPSLIEFMLEGWSDMPPLRREFDTVRFVQETFESRGGREDNRDVRQQIRKRKEARRSQATT